MINESTGEVSTLGVNNDGSVSDVGGRLVARISDRLIVTITDPQGRQTTFKRREYVAPDGRTAVGNGGGEILGPLGRYFTSARRAVSSRLQTYRCLAASQCQRSTGV